MGKRKGFVNMPPSMKSLIDRWSRKKSISLSMIPKIGLDLARDHFFGEHTLCLLTVTGKGEAGLIQRS